MPGRPVRPIPITARFAPPSPDADAALSDALALLLQCLPVDEAKPAGRNLAPSGAGEKRARRATETAGGTLP